MRLEEETEMFRTHRNFAALVALTVSGVALMFASGCTNSVSGPELRLREPVTMPRVPAELSGMEKAGIHTGVTPVVPGDLTGDGVADASDLAAFAFLMRADVNRDEVVDGADEVAMAMLLNNQVPDLAAPRGVIDASDFAAFAAARGRADLNGDGQVDASDLAGLVWMRARGDLNGDGMVSRRDQEIIVAEVTP